MTVRYAPEVWSVPMFYTCPRGCKGSAPSGRFVFGEAWPLWRVEAEGEDSLVAGVMVDCPDCKTPMYARNWIAGSHDALFADRKED